MHNASTVPYNHYPRKRPHSSPKIIDLGNALHMKELLDTISWDYSASRFQRILIVLPSISEADLVYRALDAIYPGEVFSASRLTRRQMYVVPQNARIAVTISVVCELGLDFSDYSTMYVLAAPSCSSTFDILGKMLNSVRPSDEAGARVRVFSDETPESQLNARWVENSLRNYAPVLHTEINRMPRLVPRRQAPDAVGILVLDDIYNLYGGLVIGPCTAGEVDKLSYVTEKTQFVRDYKASPSDMFLVQRVVYELLDQRHRPVVVCRTPDALLRGNDDYMSPAARLRILRYATRVACKSSQHLFPYLRDAVNKVMQETQ